MLVLSREKGEEIVIGAPGNEIVILLVEVRGHRARIGVQASKHVPVHRREVWDELYGKHRKPVQPVVREDQEPPAGPAKP